MGPVIKAVFAHLEGDLDSERCGRLALSWKGGTVDRPY
jgi:hypothetical protein